MAGLKYSGLEKFDKAASSPIPGWEPQFCCLGFIFNPAMESDLYDYVDFKYTTWTRTQLESDLKFEALPSGMLLRSPEGLACVVMNSKLCFLDSQLKVVGGEGEDASEIT